MKTLEHAFWNPRVDVMKWGHKSLKRAGVREQTLLAPEFGGMPGEQLLALGITPDEVTTVHGNQLTTAGITRMFNLLTNQGSTQAFDATHTRIGVGDGNPAGTAPTVAAGDTDLAAASGSTHRLFNLVSGAGTVSTNTLQFSATFASADANFTSGWWEWGIDQGTAQGTTVVAPLLNHKGVSMGTKVSGATWTLQVTITIT